MKTVFNLAGGAIAVYMGINTLCGGFAMYNGGFQNPGEDFGHGFVYGHNMQYKFVAGAAKVIGGAAYDAVMD